MNSQVKRLFYGACFFVALCVAFLIYLPALSGPFLLDDLIHLPKLRGGGAVTSWTSFYDFVFSGEGTPGRVLSFLSLLINDHAWPSLPYAFKYTNLMLHLLNGVLVFILVRLLIDNTRYKSVSLQAALVCMFIWLVHPMQVSTVMYVIQRITILCSTFILAALCAYCYGRTNLQNNFNRYLLYTSIGIVGFGAIAFLFKEIAVNLLFYILVIELIVFRGVATANERAFKLWFAIFVCFPILMLVLYFSTKGAMLEAMASRRDFTIYERLLTEPRVLFDYLSNILIPKLSGLTLYHDDYVISRSLFSPVSTFFAIIGIFGAIFIAFLSVKQLPLISFAVFWFLAGHVLESTFIPIELYFEHRNYLPMLGPIMAITVGAFAASQKIKKLCVGFLFIYVAIFSALSLNTAKVWGHSVLLTNVWLDEHPTSVRAAYDMVRLGLIHGKSEQARKHLLDIGELRPDKISVAIFDELHFHCGTGLDTNINDEFVEKAKTARFDLGVLTGIQQLNTKLLKGNCKSLSIDTFLDLTFSFIDNPNFQGYKKGLSNLYEAVARSYVEKRDLDKTMFYMDKTYEAFPRYKIRIQQAVLLMTAGLFDDAQLYINKAKETRPRNIFRIWAKNRSIKLTQTALDFYRDQASLTPSNNKDKELE